MILRIGPFDNYFTIQVLVEKDQRNIPYDLSNSDGIFLNFSDGSVQLSAKNIGSQADLKNGALSFALTPKDSQKVRSFKNRRYSISARIVKVDGSIDENGIAYGEWIEYEKVAETKYTEQIQGVSKDIVSLQKRIAENQVLIDQNNQKTDSITKENLDLQKNLASLKQTQESYASQLADIQRKKVLNSKINSAVEKTKNKSVQILG